MNVNREEVSKLVSQYTVKTIVDELYKKAKTLEEDIDSLRKYMDKNWTTMPENISGCDGKQGKGD